MDSNGADCRDEAADEADRRQHDQPKAEYDNGPPSSPGAAYASVADQCRAPGEAGAERLEKQKLTPFYPSVAYGHVESQGD